MGAEKVKLFGKIELDVMATVPGTFTLLTDIPGYAMAQRFSFSVPATSTRRPVTSRLPFNTQGHLIQASYILLGAGPSTLYGVRVWARELPGGQWGWYSLPVIESPVEFTPMALPIPQTPEAFSAISLPIPPTPNEWSVSSLPIPPTPEEWRAAALPIKPTPVVPDWMDLEMDQ